MASLSRHAEDKLQQLAAQGVTREDVEATIESPDLILSDAKTGNLVAINYAAKIAVAYSTRGGRRTVTTIIYAPGIEDLVRRRRRSGRWNPL